MIFMFYLDTTWPFGHECNCVMATVVLGPNHVRLYVSGSYNAQVTTGATSIINLKEKSELKKHSEAK